MVSADSAALPFPEYGVNKILYSTIFTLPLDGGGRGWG
jgi:hypothetical protein